MSNKINVGAYISFVLIAIIMCSRALYIAPDDISYIQHFSGNYYSYQSGSVWEFVIEEGLFHLYTKILLNILPPELSLRFTIFVSTLGFLIFSNKVSGDRFAYVIIIFIVSNAIGTQLYYNQIRQGLALTIFLLGNSKGFSYNSIYYTIVAALLHTAFLPVMIIQLFVLTVFKYIHKYKYTLLIMSIMIFLFALFSGYDISTISEYFGRRMYSYSFSSSFNVVYYVLLTIITIFIFTQIKVGAVDLCDRAFYYFTLLFSIFSITSSMVYTGAGRLMYFWFVFISLIISKHNNVSSRKKLSIIWIAILLVLNLHEVLSGVPQETSWVGRWISIISTTSLFNII